jgi:hypothetical protein
MRRNIRRPVAVALYHFSNFWMVPAEIGHAESAREIEVFKSIKIIEVTSFRADNVKIFLVRIGEIFCGCCFSSHNRKRQWLCQLQKPCDSLTARHSALITEINFREKQEAFVEKIHRKQVCRIFPALKNAWHINRRSP